MPKRLGSTTPRLWTPPLRELTPETSLGYSVCEFAEWVGLELVPWQRWLLIHALELLEDGTFRFRTVLVFVARQNGKSTLSQVLGLWAMYVLQVALVLGTAQDLETAEAIWTEAVDLVHEVPDLAAEVKRVDKTNGKKALTLVGSRSWKVKAANRRAGRSSSGDLVLLDELREHTSWDAWGAITHTTMARPNAQVWALSNAGDAASIVARYLRRAAHRAGVYVGETGELVVDPDGLWSADELAAEAAGDRPLDAPDEDLETGEDSLAIFEWSAPPGCEKWDRDGWALANPSLGYGFMTERAIAAAAAADPEWTFRTEVLCQWSDGTLEGPFPPGSWEAGIDVDSRIADGAELAWCVDVAWDRSWAYVDVCGSRADGLPHVEVAARRAGTEWVAGWFKERAALAPMRVAIQGTGAPASSLIAELEAIVVEVDGEQVSGRVTVVPWSGPELGKACGTFYDLVSRCLPAPGEDEPDDDLPRGLRHLPQPVLDVAAGTAVTKPLGDAWAWNRQASPTDVAPLVAATGAVWLWLQPGASPPSAYEEGELMVV